MAGTQRFANLPKQKRQRIEEAAREEFAQRGFEQANTNRIARAAQISVGALFKYFPTKKDLFLHVVAQGGSTIESLVQHLLTQDEPVLEIIHKLFELVVATTEQEPTLVQLYHEITTTGNWELAQTVARELEGFTSEHYSSLMRRGQQSGELREDLAPEVMAFMLDNMLVCLQFALGCEYFRHRKELYLQAMETSELVEQAMTFLRAALQNPVNVQRKGQE